MIFVILILAIFFAFNMGGASFAASFAAPYGAKITSRIKASLLFITFVALGATLFGQNVSLTLGEGIIAQEMITPKAVVVIFLSAGLSMFVANVMKIPQSTSLVTVASIAGVGIYVNNISIKTILYFVPFWFLLPLISYFLTYFITGFIYPPRKTNFWVYQKFVNKQNILKRFVLISSCYNAFSVGTNNVPNVVGPLLGATNFSMVQLLLVFAVIYGVGSFIFTGPIETAGEKVVPLGLLTATIISLVSGTLMIIASLYGVPQSFVMLQMGAIFAISSLKEGSEITFKNPIAKKTLYTWTINPIITVFLSLGLAALII